MVEINVILYYVIYTKYNTKSYYIRALYITCAHYIRKVNKVHLTFRALQSNVIYVILRYSISQSFSTFLLPLLYTVITAPRSVSYDK